MVLRGNRVAGYHSIYKQHRFWIVIMSIDTGAGVSKQIISDLKGRLLALKEHL